MLNSVIPKGLRSQSNTSWLQNWQHFRQLQTYHTNAVSFIRMLHKGAIDMHTKAITAAEHASKQICFHQSWIFTAFERSSTFFASPCLFEHSCLGYRSLPSISEKRPKTDINSIQLDLAGFEHFHIFHETVQKAKFIPGVKAKGFNGYQHQS